ncbi:MAG: hypothetical protein ACXIVO_13850 [Glycocaulis sp.]
MTPFSLDPVIIAIWSGAALYLALALALTRMVIASHGGWGGLPRKGLLISVAIFMPVIFAIAWLASLPGALRKTRRFARQLRRAR